jgi:hypothetical protein
MNFQTMFTHPTAKTIKAGSNMAEAIRSNFSNEHSYEDLNSRIRTKRTSTLGQETNHNDCDSFITTPLKKELK